MGKDRANLRCKNGPGKTRDNRSGDKCQELDRSHRKRLGQARSRDADPLGSPNLGSEERDKDVQTKVTKKGHVYACFKDLRETDQGFSLDIVKRFMDPKSSNKPKDRSSAQLKQLEAVLRSENPTFDEDREEAKAAFEAGRLIQVMRRQNGWSQAELAERLGISQSRVSALESGGRGSQGPTYMLLKKIAMVCGFQLNLGFQPISK